MASRPYSFLSPLSPLSGRIRFTLPLLFVLGGLLLLFSSETMETRIPLRAVALDSLAYSSRVIAAPFAWGKKTVQRALDLYSIETLYREQQRELDSLRFLQDYATRLEQENRRLRDKLQFRIDAIEAFQYRSVGRILTHARGAFAHNVIVNVGSLQGVEKGDVALARGRLVGYVVAVGKRAARVRLIKDPQSRIAVKILDTDRRALLSGRGNARPYLLFPQGEDPLEPRAEIVTSGEAGLLPPDIPVGKSRPPTQGHTEVSLYIDVDKQTYLDIIDYQPQEDQPQEDRLLP